MCRIIAQLKTVKQRKWYFDEILNINEDNITIMDKIFVN